MKKLFALVLAVVMICAMSTSVFAERVVGGSDGVAAFDPKDSSANLAISATIGDTNHRYAIDIEFPTMTFEVAGSNLTWDVNKLEYVTTGSTTLTDKTFNITITNYSDLSVWYKVAITDNDNTDGVEVDATHATGDLEDGVEIKKANAQNHTPTTDTFTIAVDGDDWTEITEYWAGKLSAAGVASLPMATATVTFSSVVFS